jgi:hypothetical protein
MAFSAVKSIGFAGTVASSPFTKNGQNPLSRR